MARARRLRWARATPALAALAWTSPALAHSPGLSIGSYAWKGGQVEASMAFALGELAGALPRAVVGDGSWVALLANEQGAGAWIRERVTVRADAAVCTTRSTAMHLDGDGVVFDLVFACVPPDAASDVERLSVATPFIVDLPPGHRHVVKLGRTGAEVDAVLTARDPAFAVQLREPAPVSGWALAVGVSIVTLGLGASVLSRSRRLRRPSDAAGPHAPIS